MSETPFQKGDLVKALPSTKGVYSYTCNGWIGRVKEVRDDDILVKKDTNPEKGSPFWVKARYFEKVKQNGYRVISLSQLARLVEKRTDNPPDTSRTP